MKTYDELYRQIEQLDKSGMQVEAELILDNLTQPQSKVTELAKRWDRPKGLVQHFISFLYNQIALSYGALSAQAERRGNIQSAYQAAVNAERCFEKAFDIYGISAEEVLYFPSNWDYRNFVTSFFGLGSSTFALQKYAESRYYLELCLRLPANDERTAMLQRDAQTLYNQLP